MAFDFSRLAPVFAGFGGGPGAAFGVHEMQQKQRASKLGAQVRSRFYAKMQEVAPGDVAGLQAAVLAGYHDIQSNPELAAADPDLMDNLLAEAKNLQELMQAQQPEYIKSGEDILMADPKKPGELTMVHQAMPAALKEMAAIAGDPEVAKRMLMAEHQTKTDLMRAQTQAALRGPQPTAAQDALRAKMALVPTLEAKGVSAEAIQLWLSGQMELRQVQQTDMQGQSITRNMLVPTAPGFDAVEIPGQPTLPQPDTSKLVQPSEPGAAPTVEGMSNPRYGPAEAIFGAGAAPMVESTVGSVARQAGAQSTNVGLAAQNRRTKIQQYQQKIMGLRESARVPAAELDRMVNLVGGESVLADPLSMADKWIQLRGELEGRLRNAEKEAQGAQSPKTRESALEAAQAFRNFLAEFPTYTELEAAREDIRSGAVDLSPGAAEKEIERGVEEAVNGGGSPMMKRIQSAKKVTDLPGPAELTDPEEIKAAMRKYDELTQGK